MAFLNNMEEFEAHTNRICNSQFGKEPDRIRLQRNEHCIILTIEGLVDMKDARLPEMADEIYTHVHTLLSHFVVPFLKRRIEAQTELHTDLVFTDWKQGTNMAIMAMYLDRKHIVNEEDLYKGKAEIHLAVGQITKGVQKTPEEIESFWVGDDTLCIIRKGLLIGLEKHFVKKGLSDPLRVTKRSLEISHFMADLHIEQILSRQLDDVYLDWVFEQDISLLAYTFK